MEIPLPPHNDRLRLYETDYLQWLEITLKALRYQNFDQVDWDALIEEVEDMGRSERRGFESNLIVVLVHLLKWQYQSDRRSGSWAGSLVEHRRRLNSALKESPSLNSYFASVLEDAYLAAVKQAKAETGLLSGTFPASCPYRMADILDDDFLPH